MGISLIAAIGKNREIGLDNKLLWHIREDFQWFKQKTAGKMVVMGRNTFISIGEALPNRYNIVLSKLTSFTFPDVKILNSVADVLDFTWGVPEVMVIGGAKVYEQFLPYADRLYLTELDKEFVADSFFPVYDKNEWLECFTADGTEDVGFDYKFKVYKKKLK
jgi:dihydrofolate reductase